MAITSALQRASRLFLNPRSPAAIYKRPQRFLSIAAAALVNSVLRIDTRVFRSTKVRCEVCGWAGRFFGAHGAASVDLFEWNVVCLGCGSTHRTRILLLELERRIDLETAKLIVEGGGSRASVEFFKRFPAVDYRNFDPYKLGSDDASANALPIEAKSCDAVLSCHVLEHIPDYQKAVGEMARVLKPDGIALIVVPQTRGLRKSHETFGTQLDGYGHVWDFGDDFPDLLSHSGLYAREIIDDGRERLNVCSPQERRLTAKS